MNGSRHLTPQKRALTGILVGAVDGDQIGYRHITRYLKQAGRLTRSGRQALEMCYWKRAPFDQFCCAVQHSAASYCPSPVGEVAALHSARCALSW
jgi:hypothetical protein